MVDEDLIPRYITDLGSSTSSERLLRRWADRRSPAARQTTPQARTPDEAPDEEERAAQG